MTEINCRDLQETEVTPQVDSVQSEAEISLEEEENCAIWGTIFQLTAQINRGANRLLSMVNVSA